MGCLGEFLKTFVKFVVILTLIVIGFVTLIAVFDRGPGAGPSAGTGASTTARDHNDLMPGDTGYLGHPDDPEVSVFLARSWPAYDELKTFVNADDTTGMGRLIGSGQALMLDPGTPVKVLDLHFTGTRVRVLDGEHAGVDGYVIPETVRPE